MKASRSFSFSLDALRGSSLNFKVPPVNEKYFKGKVAVRAETLGAFFHPKDTEDPLRARGAEASVCDADVDERLQRLRHSFLSSPNTQFQVWASH